MPFIFIDGMGKAETDKRKLIRKYVMLGKNRGKTRKAKSTTLPNPEHSKMDQDGSSDLVIKMQYSKIPDKIGNDLSFTRLAAPVEPALMQDVLKCEQTTSIHFRVFIWT
ncbi:hypothetical protein N7474_007331 [Penicillium riverlandense]|uniref:uncharacterized protein n=1 Tax=Penicillium riverlandense TaxID=1903569 RepID=UPI002546AEC4|nr:uncharacterized protein N7474_007331 [Penicillium riverlandense]KAJ5815554.1 hypothetical protein N7474_007331 [Penicillium riverlandense]